jgi:hypothetical protein
MAFFQATITDVTAVRDGADLLITWTSTAADGTLFQVYVGRVLAWHGITRSCLVPMPLSGVATRIDVGTVASSEGIADLSGSLPTPAGGGARVKLDWLGGSYLGADIAGFHVYSGTAPGGAGNYATPIATVAAYVQGMTSDGYGVGGYGVGGYGSAGASYSYTTEPLSGGTWNFGIKPFDMAGNEGTAQTQSAVIAAPPRPPAANASDKRLTFSYNNSTHLVTLNWLASP